MWQCVTVSAISEGGEEFFLGLLRGRRGYRQWLWSDAWRNNFVSASFTRSLFAPPRILIGFYVCLRNLLRLRFSALSKIDLHPHLPLTDSTHHPKRNQDPISHFPQFIHRTDRQTETDRQTDRRTDRQMGYATSLYQHPFTLYWLYSDAAINIKQKFNKRRKMSEQTSFEYHNH